MMARKKKTSPEKSSTTSEEIPAEVKSNTHYATMKKGPRGWDMHIYAMNGHQLYFSNQGYDNRHACRSVFENFLNAVRQGTVRFGEPTEAEKEIPQNNATLYDEVSGLSGANARDEFNDF